jgi:hypothetical protein
MTQGHLADTALLENICEQQFGIYTTTQTKLLLTIYFFFIPIFMSISDTTSNLVHRVSLTKAAEELIDNLRADNGELLFHQSGGCCDGSQPMCYPIKEFRIGMNDVCLGTIHGCNFYMSGDQFEYWKHTQLTIDVVKGRGASFSLEIPFGVRFITLSRLFTDDELEHLAPLIAIDNND